MLFFPLLLPPPLSLSLYEMIEAGRGKKRGGALWREVGGLFFFPFKLYDSVSSNLNPE